MLSRWQDCWLGLECGCGRSSHCPIKLLIAQRGDMLLARALSRMRCERCRLPPSSAYLQETHHRAYPEGTSPGIYQAPGWWLDLLGE